MKTLPFFFYTGIMTLLLTTPGRSDLCIAGAKECRDVITDCANNKCGNLFGERFKACILKNQCTESGYEYKSCLERHGCFIESPVPTTPQATPTKKTPEEELDEELDEELEEEGE